MCITLRDFLDLSMDDYYKINIFGINSGKELLKQVEIKEIEDKLGDLINAEIGTWDLEVNGELTINIED